MDTENARRLAEFGFAKRRQFIGVDSALAGLAAGGAEHCRAVPDGGGMGEDGSTAERLVIGVGDDDQDQH